MAEPTEILTSRDDHLADLLQKPSPTGLSDVVRYDHSKQTWHVWDGYRWAPDRTKQIIDLVHERALAWWAGDLTADQRKSIMPLYDTAKKESVLKALSSRPGIAMAGDEWDPRPELIAFTNGVLNLATMEFDPRPSPDLLLSRSTRQPWDPKAECPLFMKFLGEVMGDDSDLLTYLIRVLGYSMFGWQREQKFWMWVGQGQNGKGTLAKVMAHVLGDYGASPSAELYMKTRFGAARSDVARPDLLRLQGVRWSWMSEPSGGQFHDELLKAHTGDDPITARDLYGKASSVVTFRPTHTIIFLTNNPPRTEDVGASMQRRVRLIHFLQDFSGLKDDKGLEDKLKKEAPGILRLLAVFASERITNVADMSYDPIPEPEQVLEWSREYISDNDPLTGFISNACDVGREMKCSAAAIWAAYQDWALRNDGETGSQMGFGLALGRRFKKVRTGTGYWYEGIKPKSVMQVAEDDRQ